MKSLQDTCKNLWNSEKIKIVLGLVLGIREKSNIKQVNKAHGRIHF